MTLNLEILIGIEVNKSSYIGAPVLVSRLDFVRPLRHIHRISDELVDLPLLLFDFFVIAGLGISTKLFNYDIEVPEIFFFHHLLQYEALVPIYDGLSDKAIFDVHD